MVVDTYLAAESQSRVACETLTTTNKVVLAGEVRGPEIKKEDLIEKVRHCIKDIGYDQEGFTWKEATSIESHLHAQSADIAIGVDSSGNKDEGAGDQGIMFGYACNETDVLMPAPIHYSHKILRLMAEDRKSGKLKNIEPDSKSQITIEYKDGKPDNVKSVVISTQHSADVNQSQVRDLIKPYIQKSIPKDLLNNLTEEEIYINPTGNFVIGGPDGDSGLTGRKIIVDTYGGAAPHGGGAFSGKDPTKVDRSAAYASRYVAKNVVASGIADKCLIQLAYAIGVSKPLSIYVDLFDNDLDKNKFVVEKINENFDMLKKKYDPDWKWNSDKNVQVHNGNLITKLPNVYLGKALVSNIFDFKYYFAKCYVSDAYTLLSPSTMAFIKQNNHTKQVATIGGS